MRTTSVGPSGRCKGTMTRTSRSPPTCATQGSSRVRSPRSMSIWPGWPRATPNESDAPALLCSVLLLIPRWISVCAGPLLGPVVRAGGPLGVPCTACRGTGEGHINRRAACTLHGGQPARSGFAFSREFKVQELRSGESSETERALLKARGSVIASSAREGEGH